MSRVNQLGHHFLRGTFRVTPERPLPVSEVTVVCGVSKDCVLPCSFRPSSNQTVRWFRQDLLLYSSTADNGLDQRLSLHPALVSHGNATLTIRRSGLKDRGTYRCHVISSEGEHTAKVIVKVEGE